MMLYSPVDIDFSMSPNYAMKIRCRIEMILSSTEASPSV
jgi:hypothetical protein